MKQLAVLNLLVFVASLALGSMPADAQESIVIENDLVRWEIGPDGRNLALIDKASGADYCKKEPASFTALITKAGKTYNPSKASYQNGRLSLEFAECGADATLAVAIEPRYIRLEVVSVTGEGVDQLTFGHIPLTLTGSLSEQFACCMLALNLKTNVPEIPGPNALARAMCNKRFGFEGAKAALLATPQSQLRDVMKEVVTAADELPKSSIGGPWALDAPGNRGSYLFDFGQCTEKTVDDWIALVKNLGLNQIDFHTGHSLRFGDCRPNPDLFPRGRESVKAVIDKLHEAGISAGLHTYAFFIAKDTPYVTPVPDPRLGKDATFTLAEDIAVDAVVVPVVEPTEMMSTTTGFFVRNSVTLQVDNELIIYAGLSKEPPFAFTQCTRGAYGTTAAPHSKDAKVHHIKECFGLFAPDADSTLLAEVAANTAETFNECGFDMIYLDALDGEDILGGAENSWHYGSKFVFEIANRLEKPALFEMSTFHHHLWYVRARMGAWDHPNRSHKRFIDVHVAANRSGDGMFLPMNLGWWAVKTWQDGPGALFFEPTFPDDIEYLMCKCIGNGFGLSLMGVNPGNIGDVPAFQTLAPTFRQYEELRHADYFPEEIKARLRVPGDEFTLEKDPEDKWRFRPIEYAKHKVSAVDGRNNVWNTNNAFAEQPLRVRIEALVSAAPYDAPEAIVVEDFTKGREAFDIAKAQNGVAMDLLSPTPDDVKALGLPESLPEGTSLACLTALNGSDQPAAAWAQLGKSYPDTLNLGGHEALGVWVHGDGQGEVLNMQLMSPPHISHGLGDRYIRIDFTGWRYFELLEMEGAGIEEFNWPYGGAYAVYREDVKFDRIETMSFWYNNLPKDKEVRCHVAPVKALPLVQTTLHNPRLTVGGTTLTFPCDIETGCYLVFQSESDCKLYGKKGELLAEVKPEGEVPTLKQGGNTVEFGCEVTPEVNARARVTVITKGEPL